MNRLPQDCLIVFYNAEGIRTILTWPTVSAALALIAIIKIMMAKVLITCTIFAQPNCPLCPGEG